MIDMTLTLIELLIESDQGNNINNDSCCKNIILNNNENNDALGFISIFREKHVWCKLLNLGVKLLEDMKQFDACREIYKLLLQNCPCSYKRGKWYVRCALILDYHLQLYDECFRWCQEGLGDKFVNVGERMELMKRYNKLYKKIDQSQKKKKTKINLSEPLRGLSTISTSDDVMMMATNIRTIVVEGNAITKRTGQKSHFYGINNEVLTVEEIILEHFSQVENGQWCGIHWYVNNAISFINNNNNYFYLIYLKKKSEGSLYRMIFGLFMWNVIYNDNIPFVFQQPFQSSPLDLNTPFFYMNRVQLIRERVEKIAKMESSDIASYLHEIWSGHFNESAICVTWNGRWILSDIINAKMTILKNHDDKMNSMQT
ncbi:hypothetical protein RFI_15652 [Reticulomyxa filosa]|uniref:Fanconi-associated nuclease n=2 Tax=Reticulomyxa filosa TaxID=46433 RepID=X6N8C3_RETFI|nr:hypothetical protein RFI_15652 [Reticulomyxa filosa]|eukprot:ETO21552.1 hypothetical protein RFI_15652 [Reticulomyxa filosa]